MNSDSFFNLNVFMFLHTLFNYCFGCVIYSLIKKHLIFINYNMVFVLLIFMKVVI